MLYKVFVRYALTGIVEYIVRVNNKWELFGFIGYLTAFSMEQIERFDYCICKDRTINSEDIIDIETLSKRFINEVKQ